jgi:hypothetical protein
MTADDEMMKVINAIWKRAMLRASADFGLSLAYPASDELYEALMADPEVKAMMADRAMAACLFRAWLKSDDVDGMTKQ